jgi:hypothetical protein
MIILCYRAGTENGERRAEDGERRTESGGRRAENGGRRTEGGERRAEDGGPRALADGFQKYFGRYLDISKTYLTLKFKVLLNIQWLTQNT